MILTKFKLFETKYQQALVQNNLFKTKPFSPLEFTLEIYNHNSNLIKKVIHLLKSVLFYTRKDLKHVFRINIFQQNLPLCILTIS